MESNRYVVVHSLDYKVDVVGWGYYLLRYWDNGLLMQATVPSDQKVPIVTIKDIQNPKGITCVSRSWLSSHSLRS